MEQDNQNMPKKVSQKSNSVSLLSGVLILAIGIVLIVFNKLISGEGIVVLAGILFLLTGIVNILVSVTKRDADGKHQVKGTSRVLGWMVSISSIILGICMLVFSATFTAMIPFIFGILIFFGAITLAIMMLFGVKKYIRTPGWLWVMPLIMVVLGIITMTKEGTVDDRLIMILTGISLTCFGACEILLGAMVSGSNEDKQ